MLLKKGSLEITSREIIILILAIIILAVILMIGFGFFDRIQTFWGGFSDQGEGIAEKAIS